MRTSFRKFKDTKEIIAVNVDDTNVAKDGLCQCFSDHVGLCYPEVDTLRKETIPAKPNEYCDLLRAITRKGNIVQIVDTMHFTYA